MNACPYGTYLRATRGHHVRTLTPLRVCRLIRRRIAKRSRRGGNAQLRAQRKAVYAGAIAYLREDVSIMDRYRF